MPYQTFWIEATGEVEVSLRRYTFPAEDDCPASANGHDASVMIGRAAAHTTREGRVDELRVEGFAHDERWPRACPCGHVFDEAAHWQVNQELVYVRPDTGREWTARNLPVGALFHAPWLVSQGVGADGIALVCILPPESNDSRGRYWHVDGPARGEGQTTPHAWRRTGDPRAVPPTVDVTPSIQSNSYHGWLRGGVLSDS